MKRKWRRHLAQRRQAEVVVFGRAEELGGLFRAAAAFLSDNPRFFVFAVTLTRDASGDWLYLYGETLGVKNE